MADDRPDGFRWYRWAFAIGELPGLSMAAKLAAWLLAYHADPRGHCFPSRDRLAGAAGVTPRTITKAVAELKGMGLVDVDHGKGRRPSRYHLIEIGGSSVPPRVEADVHAGWKQRSTQRGSSVPPELSKELSKEVSNELSREAETESLPTEARPRVAPNGLDGLVVDVFCHWARQCRRGSNVQLTAGRARAARGRIRLDGFSVAELKLAVDGAALALENDELDYGHRDTEFYRIVMDADHVRTWIEYAQTGDYTSLSEMLLAEGTREAA